MGTIRPPPPPRHVSVLRQSVIPSHAGPLSRCAAMMPSCREHSHIAITTIMQQTQNVKSRGPRDDHRSRRAESQALQPRPQAAPLQRPPAQCSVRPPALWHAQSSQHTYSQLLADGHTGNRRTPPRPLDKGRALLSPLLVCWVWSPRTHAPPPLRLHRPFVRPPPLLATPKKPRFPPPSPSL